MFLRKSSGRQLDGVQGRGYLPPGDRGRDRVVIRKGKTNRVPGVPSTGGVHSAVSQRVHSAVGERVHSVRPDVHRDPEMLARVLARGLRFW